METVPGGVFGHHSHGRIPGNGGCRKAKQQPCCDRRCRVGLFLGSACNWKQAFISIARGCGGGFPLGGVLVLFFCGGRGVYEYQNLPLDKVSNI